MKRPVNSRMMSLTILGSRAIRAVSLISFIVFALSVAYADKARAQENSISAPPPLQWPTPARPDSNFLSLRVLRDQVEEAGNEELCKILMKEANKPIPQNFEWSLCPPEFQAKVTGREGKVNWAAGAKPSECGTSCFGRPFLTQSQFLDRPNTLFAMLYGHLDFNIDVPGPFNRKVRFGYEAQFRCAMNGAAREGSLNLRVVFGTPVVEEPGILESIIDFALLPANISRAVETGIRRRLTTPGPEVEPGLDRCTSIGASAHPQASPSLDAILFDRPKTATRPSVHKPPSGALLDKSATVRLLRITRKPVFGYTPPAEPGQFTIFLNGAGLFLPDIAAANLPPAGGSAGINFCATINTSGADRLQLIFVNTHGGAVWSQFAANANFGAGPQRTMMTGRRVVVPGTPVPPSSTPGKPSGGVKPKTIILREFELLYRIEYLAPPTQTAAKAPPSNPTGATPNQAGRVLTGPRATQVTGQLTTLCRQI